MHEHWREQQALLNRSQDPTRNLQTSQTALQQPLQSGLLPASPLASTSLTGTTQSCQPTQLLSTSNNLQSVTTTQRQCTKQQSLFRNRGNPANLSQQTAPTQTPTSTCSMQPPTSMQTPISAVAQQPNYQAAILVIVYDVFGTNPSFNTGGLPAARHARDAERPAAAVSGHFAVDRQSTGCFGSNQSGATDPVDAIDYGLAAFHDAIEYGATVFGTGESAAANLQSVPGLLEPGELATLLRGEGPLSRGQHKGAGPFLRRSLPGTIRLSAFTLIQTWRLLSGTRP